MNHPLFTTPAAAGACRGHVDFPQPEPNVNFGLWLRVIAAAKRMSRRGG